MKALSMKLLGSCLVRSLATRGGTEAGLEESAPDEREVNRILCAPRESHSCLQGILRS